MVPLYPEVRLPRLIPAVLEQRPNRFVVIARQAGGQLRVACRDPGRMEGLLTPGAPLLLDPTTRPGRKTAATLVLIKPARQWVCVVPTLANTLFEAALATGRLEGLRDTRLGTREVTSATSRLDFLLRQRGRPCWTEIKSVTLVREGRGLFPDAPTARGVRQVQELERRRRSGEQALLVFVVQRPDAESVTPFAARDPAFAHAVVQAARAGVRLRAYTCRVSPRGCRLERRVPVHLPS